MDSILEMAHLSVLLSQAEVLSEEIECAVHFRDSGLELFIESVD